MFSEVFFMEKSDYLQILFIRHAETDYDDFGDRDRCDGNLTEKGEKQCKQLGKILKDVQIDGFVTSSLLRAFKTAAGVCKEKDNAPTLCICPEIIECGCTTGYYGCGEEYLKKYYKNAIKIESLFGGSNPQFGCESVEENNLRAEKFIEYIMKNHTFGQTVAVFSHHGMLEYLIPTALGIETQNFSMSFNNISITRTDICKNGERILRYLNRADAF